MPSKIEDLRDKLKELTDAVAAGYDSAGETRHLRELREDQFRAGIMVANEEAGDRQERDVDSVVSHRRVMEAHMAAHVHAAERTATAWERIASAMERESRGEQ